MSQHQKSNEWIEIRSRSGKLLFRFHPRKRIAELKQGDTYYNVDLDEITVSERPSTGDTGRLLWSQ